MPPVLNLKPEEVDSNEKRSGYTVSVVGCGRKGVFFGNAFADSGFKVICTDTDPMVMKKVSRGKTGNASSQIESKLKSYINSGQISVSNERKKAVSQSDIIIIAIGAKVDEQKTIDNSKIVSACKQVGSGLQKGALIIYCGIAGIGFTNGTLRETLENTSGLKAGVDFGLAYSPILSVDIPFVNLELIAAANDQTSLTTASTMLKTLTKKVKEVNDTKLAETATLFMVAKQDANRALANELAVLCENAKTDFFKILKLLELSDTSFFPTIMEEENRNESYLLIDSADSLNSKLRLSLLARQINEDIVKHAVNLTQNALRSVSKPLRRAKIAVISSASPTADMSIFIKMIEQKGAKPTVYDSISKVSKQDWGVIKSSLNEAVEGADCIVLLSGQEQTKSLNLKKLKPLTKSPSVIVDLTGFIDPGMVEAEGFLYFGLGRGNDRT
jgi:UDP-N-acetyl-D-mannosaminuronate dehydrogenase